jgi:DNA replication and repair protein RecF
MNIIIGGNAQGKTNLLEAIHFLGTAKSHRTHNEDELIRWKQTEFYIKGEVESKAGLSVIEIFNVIGQKKRIKINQKFEPTISKLLGKSNVVIFSPEAISLPKGSPTERRRFLDLLISQISHSYLKNLQTYYYVLKQRNELLKQISLKKASEELLPPWDIQLVESGLMVIEKRNHIISKLNQLVEATHLRLTNGSEKLKLEYLNRLNHNSNLNVKDMFIRELEANRKYELSRGLTSVGPHRDDLSFIINGLDAKKFSSQGQLRTATLSVKLSELELMRKESGEYPIFLLDDVTSELDSWRISSIFELIKTLPVQIFITSPHDLDNLELGEFKPARFIFKHSAVSYQQSAK